ncbi:hypothetical protein Q777_GL002294 [Lacticaseibacillus rhamnosus DSM 20021 = JCM 1136 = NBRC 3425]|uniref:Uncharacterized protein n=1 Tax=Lacticaseibacillus rhamnosus (strain LMS2-1) TaxID=525361 RepID=C2JWM4_LACRM|nr:conserved hypothetical protein [Lacticaseibacillus rhamnosus ATCC 8530]EEN80602.1 hypothetical protein HMPREF0539_1308 [Lacticaseibacillus rhamnosus LMS2-1]KRK31402.1 hypothetical protein Q777_GL002294 [Lacticaseibacillus rhamnosus DSM 20021 = JCM 1136 = NBRC 3425]CAR90114.1 Putative protein without homology [Lacticaseibacillus rhamnosus Lc 705]
MLPFSHIKFNKLRALLPLFLLTHFILTIFSNQELSTMRLLQVTTIFRATMMAFAPAAY